MYRREWEIAQQAIEKMGLSAYLLVDGMDVQLEPIESPTREKAILIHVNHEIPVQDCLIGSYVALKLCRWVEKDFDGDEEVVKVFLKTHRKLGGFYKKNSAVYVPIWNSFAALKKHFIENNNFIHMEL